MSVATKPLNDKSIGELKQSVVAAAGHPSHSTVVITRNELTRLKDLIRGEETARENKARAVDERERFMETAQQRKQRMVAMDEERRSKGVVKPMEEIEREVQRKQDISLARAKLNEEIDEVKFMNKVTLYAKCVTVRDAQIQEKKAIRVERSEEEKKMDMMMEMERLKALRMYEEREQKRIEDRRKGAAVIRAQIEEREQERLRKLELKQQEQEAMLRHIERMKEDDRSEAIKKKEGAKRLMEDVALANAEQIRLKNRQREMEQEEERQIHEYIRDKERREQEIQEEQEKFRAEKEKEVARLRTMQEKAQDKQAELDALRARRAQEAYDREWRQKERDAKAREAAINADLSAAREQQKLEKELQLAEQGRIEKEEFERIIAVQKREDELERHKRGSEMTKRKKNADALMKQIEEIEENRRKERREFLEEGQQWKAEQKARETLVDSIRQAKLTELERQQVPKQYRNEIMKKRNAEPLRPSK